MTHFLVNSIYFVLELMAENENSCGLEEIGIFQDDTKIKKFAFTLDGNVTDIVVCDYSDKQLIIITQFQKLGTLISVTKGGTKSLGGIGAVYEIKTICGLDNQDYHLASRYLAEQLSIVKPVLFSICLKDVSVRTLRIIAEALKTYLDY